MEAALQDQVRPVATSSPAPTPTPPLSVVDIPSALRAYGMSTMDHKLFPTAKQIKYVKDAQSAIKAATGVADCFVCVDIKHPAFLPERVLDKTSMLEPKPVTHDDSLISRVVDDLARVRNESIAKGVTLSFSDLVNFLNKQFILAIVTKHCDAYGGPGSLLSYHFNIISRCSTDKIATILKCGSDAAFFTI